MLHLATIQTMSRVLLFSSPAFSSHAFSVPPVKLPRVADDTCCGVHDPLQLVCRRFPRTSQQEISC